MTVFSNSFRALVLVAAKQEDFRVHFQQRFEVDGATASVEVLDVGFRQRVADAEVVQVFESGSLPDDVGIVLLGWSPTPQTTAADGRSPFFGTTSETFDWKSAWRSANAS